MLRPVVPRSLGPMAILPQWPAAQVANEEIQEKTHWAGLRAYLWLTVSLFPTEPETPGGLQHGLSRQPLPAENTHSGIRS